MTSKKLREQFEKEHPNRKAILGNMGVAGLTYCEWLENKLIEISKVEEKKSK